MNDDSALIEGSPARVDEREVERIAATVSELEAEIGKVILGQREVVRGLLVALLAGGHCLLEGVPGLAKTLMIRTLGEALELGFKRIQFTPDLMPSDILGTEILVPGDRGDKSFRFHRGPVFANLVLADEVNRSPPKTQSALLEAMQEYAVTYGGVTYPLERPFFVLATQNPIEQTGTYPLPEAQLDRFLMQLEVTYPDAETEVEILAATTGEDPAPVRAVMAAEELLAAQALVRQVHVSRPLLGWIARLVRATRPQDSDVAAVRDYVDWGAGPRAGQAVVLAAKARAFLDGRYSVLGDDVREVVPPVLRHRLVVNYKAQAERRSLDEVAAAVLEATPAPS